MLYKSNHENLLFVYFVGDTNIDWLTVCLIKTPKTDCYTTDENHAESEWINIMKMQKS